MISTLTEFRQDRHQIVSGTDVERWIKKQAPSEDRPRLFLYRHLITGNFCVGLWFCEGQRFQDVMAIGPRLSDFTRSQARRFRETFLRAETGATMLRKLRRAQRMQAAEHQQQIQSHQENRRKMVQHSGDI